MIALQVGELRPYAKKVEVIVKVLDKNEAREVHSKLDNRNHSVTEALVGDSSGTILLTLWDDAIDKLVTGKCYKLSNAFTSLFKNTLRLNLGRYGKLEDHPEDVAANAHHNLSEKEFEGRG
ncbi:MAG TPA: hypothetical protein HA252_05910 [Candidatus Diapherotrites archaeon]|uniref:Single-stranded DNA binding protein Ssb-like OB fold domain-containing protein n=1 Tax=Candidatus Iainarchaeum sp. TaxID=3101447 RepID=A0A7J4JGP0_9ARCH|nr:hypothetical protein [Candidatus Diapherotrites archaeon]HIH16912.1 hypothetical protein [Candidatus Diapherotrites archaeon]